MVENAEDIGWDGGVTVMGVFVAAYGAASIGNESNCDDFLVRRNSV